MIKLSFRRAAFKTVAVNFFDEWFCLSEFGVAVSCITHTHTLSNILQGSTSAYFIDI